MAIVQIFENGTQPPIVPRLPMGEYPMGMVPGVGDQFSDHFKRNWLKYLLAGGLLAGSAKRKYGKYSAASNKAALYDNTHNVLQQLHSELTDKNAKWDDKDRKAAIAQYKLILSQAAPTLASKLNNFGSDEEFLKHAPTYNAVVKNMANDYKIDAQKAGDKYNSSILGGLANKFGLTDVQGTPQQFSGPNSSAATDLGSLVGSAQGILNNRQQSAADALRQQADQASVRQSPPQQQSQSNPEPNPEPNPNSDKPDETSNQSARQQSNDDPSQSVIGDISDQKPSTSQEPPDDKSEPPSTDSKNTPPEIPDLSSIHDATSEYINARINEIESDKDGPELRQKRLDDLINKFTPYERELYKNNQAREEFEKNYGNLKDSQNDSDREEYNTRKQNLESHLRTNLDNKILSDEGIRSSFGEHLNTRFDPNHPGSIASAMSPQEADAIKNWHSGLISNSNKPEQSPADNAVPNGGGGESNPTPAPTPEAPSNSQPSPNPTPNSQPSPNPTPTPVPTPDVPSNSQSAPETPPTTNPTPAPTPDASSNSQSTSETPPPSDSTTDGSSTLDLLRAIRNKRKNAYDLGLFSYSNRLPGRHTDSHRRMGRAGSLPTTFDQIKDNIAARASNGDLADQLDQSRKLNSKWNPQLNSNADSLLQILKNSSLFMDDESDTYTYSEEPEDKSDTKKDDEIDNSNNRSNKRSGLSKILLAGGITALGAGAIHQLSKGAKFNASEFAKHGDIKNANKYMARKNMLSSVDVIDHVKNLVKKYKSNDN